VVIPIFVFCYISEFPQLVIHFRYVEVEEEVVKNLVEISMSDSLFFRRRVLHAAFASSSFS